MYLSSFCFRFFPLYLDTPFPHKHCFIVFRVPMYVW